MTHPNHTLVLLVDDEPVVRMVACQGLEDAGFDVIEADCAQGALDVLRSRADVAVLFTDVNMPGAFDGLDLAKLVHELWPDIQLVVTSGQALPTPVPDEGRFMAKPYRLDEMVDTVTSVAKRAI
jgi:CheY-like chemotaxis protein